MSDTVHIARAAMASRERANLIAIVEQCLRTIHAKEHFLEQLLPSLPEDLRVRVLQERDDQDNRLIEAITATNLSPRAR